MSYQSINPFDGKTLKTFEHLADRQIEERSAMAATCFEAWRNRTFTERAAIVAREVQGRHV
jgi:succinate-semialdehyde dehydrogenase / glutarate-semialdehyde dehydrogenase